MDWRGPGSRFPPRQAETAQLSPLLYRRQSVHAARSHRLKVRRGRVAEAFDGVPDLGPSWQRRQCIGHTEDAAIAEDDLLTDLGIPIERPTDRLSLRKREAEAPHWPE